MPDLIKKFLANELLLRIVEALVFRGAGFLLLFAMHLAVGRILGPNGYGIFNFGLMTASLLVIFSSMGWPTAILRLFSEYIERKEWGLLIGASKRSFQIVLLTSVLFAFMVTAVASLQAFDSDQKIGLFFAALLIPVLAIIGLVRKGLLAFDRIKTSIVFEDVLIPGLFIGVIFLADLTGVFAISIAYVGTLIFALVVSLVSFHLIFRQRVVAATVEYRTAYWSGIASAMVLGGAAQILINRIDVMMLGVMTDMASVGVYVASNRMAMIVTMSLIAVNTVVAPRMARAYHGGAIEKFREILLQGTAWSAIGSLPVVFLLFLVPGYFLGLFGDGFEHGENILRILTIGQFANALTGPAGFALLVTGRETQFAKTMGFMALINVVGNLIAIPIAGALGAAMVSAICVTALNIWQYRLALVIR